MKRTALILAGSTLFLAGCDDDSPGLAPAFEETGEGPARTAAESAEPEEPRPPSGPDSALVDRYVEESGGERPEIDVDREIRREIDDEVLEDFDLRTRGYQAASRQSHIDFSIQNFDELSEDERADICSAISGYVASGPEAMTSQGPVLLTLSADVTDDDTGRRSQEVRMYNDTLWPPDDPGDCAAL